MEKIALLTIIDDLSKVSRLADSSRKSIRAEARKSISDRLLPKLAEFSEMEELEFYILGEPCLREFYFEFFTLVNKGRYLEATTYAEKYLQVITGTYMAISSNNP